MTGINGNAQIPRVVWRGIGPTAAGARIVLVQDASRLGLVPELRDNDATGDRIWRPATDTEARYVLGLLALEGVTRKGGELGEPGAIAELLADVAAAARRHAKAAETAGTGDAEDLGKVADLLGNARSMHQAAGMRGGWL